MTEIIETRSGRLTVILTVVVGIVAGCRPAELRVPLAYRPRDHLAPGGLNVPAELRVAVIATDARTETSVIGRNTEDPKRPIPVYVANRMPDEFLRDAVSRLLAESGVRVVAEPKQANRVLALRLTRFWTEEQDLYRTAIFDDVELRDMAGAKIWDGEVAGRNSRSGRSLSFDNYEEAFSDATLALVQSLLDNKTFVNALTTERPEVAPRY